MANSPIIEKEFLSQLTALVEKNISNEQFGVSELADEMNMSRSNLLRKVKRETNLSVSQLISQVRLKRAMELLRTSSLNVSEVSHQVGFNSTSYFIKCFREYYGYPPGEVGKHDEVQADILPMPQPKANRNVILLSSIGLVLVLTLALVAYYMQPFSGSDHVLEKSIAVLPFKNESSDSTNIYLINGLMESTLNNLQKIKDLKVISRTSAEKYRHTSKSIPEMARELNVNYFVEGSGQKVGDKILLNIQLIEASTDRHLWAKQYRREAKDIFELQQEIARNITEEIKAIITPDERRQIEKVPTANLEAYDLFLKGRDLSSRGGDKNLLEAISYFNKAIEKDNEFALAYADAAMACYYLDIFQVEKKYTKEISNYADKALLFDSKLANSLVAKAMVFMHRKEYESAIPYLEKALEYNPNSILVINFLSDLYNNYVPNSAKYLEYALMGVKLDMGAYDSVTNSYTYLHLSNALMQTGFIDEALKYIDKSLAYNANNPYSGYLRVYILFAKSRDFKKTEELLIKELNKDTTRIDIMQEVAKVNYLMHDFKDAYYYYKKVIAMREAHQLDLYVHENIRMAIVFNEMGEKQKADELVERFKAFVDNNNSIYKHIFLTDYYCYTGDNEKAIEHLKQFAQVDNFQYWILLWDTESGVRDIKDLPGVKSIMKGVEKKFWDKHNEIRVTLEEKGLL
ncbi:helix-turn-helix domain-containing protein [Chryseosolibacter indicus]|uniref:Helix-turn-helix domain-containing protein n=1 Tax=Chryseosolibacter indicus TaxID=2782351 RepID=A0ABS5VWQ6_9BACT|nr:helix-turn-helix domain-containing protein [Chryseosolibacter indicus]MBT1705853.1 helix-turn-helix domain-containing protein [Chryseosolibacter indicus]